METGLNPELENLAILFFRITMKIGLK